MPLKYSNLRKLRISLFFFVNKTASSKTWHKENLDEINYRAVSLVVKNNNHHLILRTVSDKVKKE